jgi:chromosomal replication initiator protein
MSEVPKDLFDPDDEQDPSNNKKWEECLKLIKEEIPWQTFQTWFIPIIPVSYHDETLVLRAPSRFVSEWIESHFSETLNKIVKKVFGEKSKIEYLIAPTFLDKQDKIDLGHSDEKDSKNVKSLEKQTPIKIDICLNQKHTFDNYFVHRHNRMVKKAAEYITTHLDISNYNPSFYYGDPGTGKTHLLNAIGNSISVRFPDKRIILLGSEQYLHEYVCSLQNGKINDFKEVLTNSDVFLFSIIEKK